MRINKKDKILFLLVSIFIFMGIGYAYLNANLSITGISNINSAKWDVHFENIQVSTGSVTTVDQEPTIDTNKTNITYNVTLNKPGDYYEFTVDVKNGGTIDAMIESVTSTINNQSSGELPSYLKYSATYIDGIKIENNHILKSGEKETYKVRLEYNADITPEELPKTEESYEISFNPNFIQKTSAAKPIIRSVSFSADSWDTIKQVAQTGNASNYYNIGDTKEIDMGELGTHTVRIANMSTPSECSTEGFSQTACGFVIEFADILTTHAMNSEASNTGGWPASEMRTYLNDTIYNSLPQDLKNAIIETKVISGHNGTESSNYSSTDKLYLLSSHEVWVDIDGDSSKGIDYYDTSYSMTRQLDYYEENNVTSSNYSATIKKYNDSANYWWLRSADLDSSFSFARVSYTGSHDGMSSWGANGVSPAFRIG